MAVTFLLAFFGVLTVVAAQAVFPGKCNNVTTQSNFDMKKYMGRWYEIQKYPDIFQSGASCLKVNYGTGKNHTVRVDHFLSLYGYNLDVHGKMEEIHPNLKDGKLKIVLPKVPIDNEIWVLSTDYTNYSIVWSCTQFNNTNDQYAWVFSRTPNLTESQRAQINSILEKNFLDLDRFIKVNQTHCGSAATTRVSFGLFVAILIATLYKLC